MRECAIILLNETAETEKVIDIIEVSFRCIDPEYSQL